jgi:L-ribulose-5-phosphate 3-epimerase
MKFRLGIITDEVSQDLSEALAFARRYSLDTIELRSVYNQVVTELSDEQIESIQRLVEHQGIPICGLSTPIFKCNLDDVAELERHYAMAERAICIAKKLNVSLIRGFSFWNHGTFEPAVPDIVNSFSRIVPMFEKAGITFVLEFDPSVFASNARKVRMLLDAINSPNFMALYDPGNDLWDPDGEIPFPDGYEHLRGKISHIHLKDGRKTPAGIEGVAIGKGEVDYTGLLRRLIEDEYRGYLIVETHYRLNSKLTEEQLQSPAGQSFSAGGLEASEECMENLHMLLKSID